MRSIVPSRSKAELLREKIERRGAMDAGVEVKSSEYARSGQSYLSENARARLDRIKEGHQVWQDQTPAGSGVAREDSREPELWADQAHRQRSSLVHVRPFPDLSATSKAARARAASPRRRPIPAARDLCLCACACEQPGCKRRSGK